MRHKTLKHEQTIKQDGREWDKQTKCDTSVQLNTVTEQSSHYVIIVMWQAFVKHSLHLQW